MNYFHTQIKFPSPVIIGNHDRRLSSISFDEICISKPGCGLCTDKRKSAGSSI